MRSIPGAWKVNAMNSYSVRQQVAQRPQAACPSEAEGRWHASMIGFKLRPRHRKAFPLCPTRFRLAFNLHIIDHHECTPFAGVHFSGSQAQVKPFSRSVGESETLIASLSTRSRVVEILATTANGCLSELGYYPGMPQVIIHGIAPQRKLPRLIVFSRNFRT